MSEAEMKRRIIKIDGERCNGCGACADACHEGAIGMVNGKAKLLREDYCDGLGDCLPSCPADAISFEEREAPEYNEAAVLASKKAASRGIEAPHMTCPGAAAKTLNPFSARTEDIPAVEKTAGSALGQWPCQIKLVPVRAPFFDGAKLLVAADCTAYSYARFHDEFMRGKITIIGCPKLDSGDYSEKLGAIIKNNDIKSVVAVRMEVPCCGKLEAAVRKALRDSGKLIALQVVTISTDGKIIDK